MYTNDVIQRETAQIGHDRWLTAKINFCINTRKSTVRTILRSLGKKKNSKNNVTFLLIITKECSNYQNKAYDL